MKITWAIIFLFLPLVFWAQKPVVPTDSFRVTGDITQEQTISLSDLKRFDTKQIGDVVITNHKGEQKGVAKGMQGVLLKDLLSAIEPKAETPTKFSEFYLAAIASDGYKIVYSWNEVFNSPAGDHIFLVTVRDGKPINDQDDRILLVTTTDFKTGRRYLKNLKELRIARVQ